MKELFVAINAMICLTADAHSQGMINFTACATQKIIEYDDGISDASVIARAMFSVCMRERMADIEASSGTKLDVTSLGRMMSGLREPHLDMITAAVLYQRSSARTKRPAP